MLQRVKITWAMLVGCAVAGACRRDAPPQPARIVSGSMAPCLWGERWQVTCDECGCEFACGVEHTPDNEIAVCPNCGNRHVRIDERSWQAGDAVKIEPRDFQTLPPERWEIVAFHENIAAGERIAVKRVVGVPGERIAIRGGELYVNGERLQKSFDDFVMMKQVVHNNELLPPSSDDLPSRWRTANANSGWIADGVNFSYQARDGAIGSIDWLQYHNWSCAATPMPRTVDTEIRDNDYYNQGLSRALNQVSDVSVEVTAAIAPGKESLFVRLLGGDSPLAIEVSPGAGSVRLLVGDVERARASVETNQKLHNEDWNSIHIEVAVVDGRVQGQVDVDQFTFDLPRGTSDSPVALAIGAQKGGWNLASPIVWRDIYYLNPHGRAGDWEMDQPLGPDEYFLLGDNPPNSVDSRQRGSVHVDRMLGTVDPLR